MKLIRGKKINIEGGENRWVNFKYERLPNFCYWYGMLDHAIKECPERSLENGSVEEGNLQYGAWLRGDPWRRNGRDTTQSGMGRGHENRQRSTTSETRKLVECPCVTEAEEGRVGDHVIMLSNTEHNNSVGERSRFETQQDVGSVLHELGKVNGPLGKVMEKEAHLGETFLEILAPQTDTKVDMQWEKAIVENAEPTFEYTLAQTQALCHPEWRRIYLGPRWAQWR